MKKLPISILIPTMNRPKALEKTLRSYLQNGEYCPKQIVIVDQSDQENIARNIQEIVEKYSAIVEMNYIFQKEASLTKARNRAFKYATEEIVICSDDDIDIYPTTLINVYNLMKSSQIAMIAGWDDNMPHSSNIIGIFLGTKSFKNRNIGHVTNSMLGRFPKSIEKQTETMWAMGFFFVVRRSLIKKWKLSWDEKLTEYAYAEDLDFSYSYFKKAKAERKKCIFDPGVRVRHMCSQEYRTPSTKATYMYVFNRTYLSEKHHMGIKSRMSMIWCDNWRLIERIVKKENPKDLADALRYTQKHYDEIIKGNFIYPK